MFYQSNIGLLCLLLEHSEYVLICLSLGSNKKMGSNSMWMAKPGILLGNIGCSRHLPGWWSTPSARWEITQICYEELLYHMAVLPFGGTSVGWNLMKVNHRKCRALCLGRTAPGTSTHCSRGSAIGWKAVWQRSTQDPAGQKASSVLLWPGPVGWKRWSFPSTQHWRDTPQVLSSLLGSPGSLGSKSGERPHRWPRTAASDLCGETKSWGYSTWRRLQSDFTIFWKYLVEKIKGN